MTTDTYIHLEPCVSVKDLIEQLKELDEGYINAFVNISEIQAGYEWNSVLRIFGERKVD